MAAEEEIRAKDVTPTIDAFRTGDVILVDGPSGTANMGKDALLAITAQNALGSIKNLTTTATESDLKVGNYFALDGAEGTKRLPVEKMVGAISDSLPLHFFKDNISFVAGSIDPITIKQWDGSNPLAKSGDVAVILVSGTIPDNVSIYCKWEYAGGLSTDYAPYFSVADDSGISTFNTKGNVWRVSVGLNTAQPSTIDFRIDIFVVDSSLESRLAGALAKVKSSGLKNKNNINSLMTMFSNNSYVNGVFSELYIDGYTIEDGLFFKKLFKNDSSTIGFEVANSNGTIFYTQSLTNGFFSKINNSGKMISGVCDISKITYNYNQWTGTASSASINSNAFDELKSLSVMSERTRLSSAKNNLYGKSIAFFGDSITAGASANGGWCTIIGQNNSMVVSNYGVGGSCLAKKSGRTDSVIERLKAYNGNADYIIVQGGLNDTANDIEIGAITPLYNDELSETTFGGACEEICKHLQKNYSGKKYGIIVNYLIGTNSGVISRWDSFADVMVSACEKWSVPFIDLRKDGGFNLANNDLRQIYGVYQGSVQAYDSTSGYSQDERVKYNSSLWKANAAIAAPAGSFDESRWTLIGSGSLWEYDSWHCNEIGYHKCAPKIESWIRSL